MAKSAYQAPTELFDTDELLALAQYDLNKDDIESALIKLKTIVAESEAPVESMSMIARIYAQLGLLKHAQDWYEKVLEKEPDSLIESFQLGMTYFDSGEAKQALEIWEKVLKSDPVHPPALFYKGLALAQSGDIVDAKQSLDTLLKSAPTDNLYFGKAKELLGAINSPQFSAKNIAEPEQGAAVLAKDAYQTEH